MDMSSIISQIVSNRPARRAGRRSLAVAILAIVILIHTLYSWSSRSDLPSPPVRNSPESDTSLDPSPSIPEEQSPQDVPQAPELPPCTVTKVSMLYGAHKFPQLEAALESHRRHSERWHCGFESLGHDLSGRKLYSKHYFLLSTMLQEIAKPEEDRKQWLM